MSSNKPQKREKEYFRQQKTIELKSTKQSKKIYIKMLKKHTFFGETYFKD